MNDPDPGKGEPLAAGRLGLVLLLIGAALILFIHLGTLPLRGSEGRQAGISRTMLASGGLLSPMVGDEARWDQPLLSYWTALPFSAVLGGVDELSVRLPSALLALGLLALTYGLARRWTDGPTALLSAGLLLTTFGFVFWGRNAQAEMANATVIAWCLWHFLRHRADERGSWIFVPAVLMALGASLKGLTAYAVPLFSILVLSLVRRDWRWVPRARTLVAAGLASAVVYLAWPLAACVASASQEPLRAVWEDAVRLFVPAAGSAPFYATFYRIFELAAPWSLLLPVALAVDLRKGRLGESRVLEPLILGGAIFLFFTLSGSRRPYDLLPVTPFVAIVAAEVLMRFARRTLGRGSDLAVRAFGLVLGLAMVGLPAFMVAAPGSRFIPAGLEGLPVAFVLLAAAGVLVAASALSRWAYAMVGAAAGAWVLCAVWIVPWAAARLDSEGEGVVQGLEGDGAGAVDSLMARLPRPKGELAPWIAGHPLRRVKGERLTYVLSARKLVTFDLGTVTVDLSREGQGEERQLVIRAAARGGVPGYPFESTITARLRDRDYCQLEADHHRTQPSYGRKLMLWDREGIDYFKDAHCEWPGLCHNPAHLVPGPDGSPVHCTDPNCERQDHSVWSLADRHRGYSVPNVHGIIAACYLVRGFDLRPGGPPHVLRVVSNKDLWEVEVTAESEKTVEVPAGKIPCYRVGIAAKPLSKYSRKHAKEFEGPFGLTGKVGVYIDKATKQLVLVEGEIVLGATFQVSIVLADRKAEGF